MKVLLTGASGFLGQYVMRALHAAGVPVVAIGRNPPDGLQGAAFLRADLLSSQDLARLMQQAGATHLLHLAWVTEHGRYWTSELNFRWVDATTRLVQAFCEAGGQHVVVAGSCAEYRWDSTQCKEDTTPLEPATVYGVAKNATRQLVLAVCAQQNVRCAWGRVFFPFGTGEGRERLVPGLIAALQDPATRFGVNAQTRRDFLHAQDVADALRLLLQSDAQGDYNISSGEAVRIADVVEMLARLLGQDARRVLEQPSARAAGPAALVGDNRKLRALGWHQELSLAQGLERVVQCLEPALPAQEALRHGA